MAQLSTMPPLQGRNAFQVLWQLPYAIPEAQRDAVFAEDMRLWKALASGPGTVDEPPSVVPESAAAGRYPPSLTEADRARFCRRGANCLSSVEADPAPYTEAMPRCWTGSNLFPAMRGTAIRSAIRRSCRSPA
jgi:hypothetical protein